MIEEIIRQNIGDEYADFYKKGTKEEQQEMNSITSTCFNVL